MITFKDFLVEASRGEDKWDKYFAAGETETIMKDDSPLYDTFGKPTKKTVSKGDKITVLAQDYDTKPLIRVGDGEYRVKFSDIDKPFKVDLAVKGNLKPDQLGLFGPTTMAAYPAKVKKLLDDHSGIPDPQTDYLKALVDHAENPDDEDLKEKVRDMYIMGDVKDDKALQNTINNDFMEVLGPFFVVNEKPEYKPGGVMFPEAGNEPLYDFTMKKARGPDVVPDMFSSKRSGGRTNTLKVAEIVKAAEADSALKRKYKRELELLRIINDNSVKTTPDLINDWLAKTFPGKYKKAPKTIDNVSIARLEAAVAKWINEESGLNFIPLVQSAVPDLWYVKARLNTDGTLKVEPLVSGRDLGKVTLRSKSSPNHLSDKLGFAI